MATSSRAGYLQECRTIIAVVEVNAADLPDAQTDRAVLTQVVSDTDDAIVRQKYHKGEFQQATRDLEKLRQQGIDYLLRLKNAVRARYGTRSEKLAAFGLNPRRNTVRVAPTQPPPEDSKQETKKPSETGLTPPQTADSGTSEIQK